MQEFSMTSFYSLAPIHFSVCESPVCYLKRMPVLAAFGMIPPGGLQVGGKPAVYSYVHEFVQQNGAVLSYSFCW